MQKKIKVYDENGSFRELIESNYDDDIIVGSILLSLDAIDVLSKYYSILGYVMMDSERCYYPIDIQRDKIVLFEGTYNCMKKQCQLELIPYNIVDKPKYLWSRFFFEWQFMLSRECFSNNGPLVLICSNILSNLKAINYIIKNHISIYEPRDYEELGEKLNGILNALEIDINKMDYDITFKYLIDSVRNGYYIKLDNYQIKKCFYDVCSICNTVIKEKNNGEL